jgi:oxygen-independent coproporphyrinogen-3 oxidase
MLAQAVRLLEARGLRRYEISNFARAGFAARHNRRYWSGGDYLGLGPGAHSHFLEPGGVGRRYSTPADLEAYLQRFAAGARGALDHLERIDERLEPRAYLLERVYLGLRDLERGVDLDAVAQDAGCRPWAELLETLVELEQRDLLIRRGQICLLSEQGRGLADLVSREILGVQRGS